MRISDWSSDVCSSDLADSAAAFREALRQFHSPQQNVVFADVAGNIGFAAPARVPVRRSGNGQHPVPGWSGEFDWIGFVPFEELPASSNPRSALIINANNKIVPDDFRSEEHTSELQSLMRNSYAVFCLK